MREIVHMRPRAEWLPAHARAGTIWVSPWGELARVEADGSVTLIRGGPCSRPLEELRRAA
jgi:hypothetical protein